jgi:hypothetical protein
MKPKTFFILSLVGFGLALTLWIRNLLFNICIVRQGDDTISLDQLAKIGDSFGSVTSLVTIFALLGLVITLYQIDYEKTESNKNKQIQLSLEIQDLYYSLEFVQVRASAWTVRTYWEKNKESHETMAQYFLNGPDFYDNKDNKAKVIEVDTSINQLTQLQNLSRLINFWHKIVVLYNATPDSRIDPQLILSLKHEYLQWYSLLKEISDAVELQSDRLTTTKPSWIGMIEILNKIFNHLQSSEDKK